MSKISLILDDLYSLVATLLPDHVELINPYLPEDSDNLNMVKGFGITVLEGDNTHREAGCSLSYERNLELTLTRKVFSADIRNTAAMNTRRTEEKNIFEDQLILAKALESDTYLKNSGYENLSKIYLQSDSGLNYMRVNQSGIIILRSIIQIEYFEKLNF